VGSGHSSSAKNIFSIPGRNQTMAVKFLVSYLYFTDVAAFASYVVRK
jgi:hypothetical protein